MYRQAEANGLMGPIGFQPLGLRQAEGSVGQAIGPQPYGPAGPVETDRGKSFYILNTL